MSEREKTSTGDAHIKMNEAAPPFLISGGVLYRRVIDLTDKVKVKGAWFNDPYTTVKWGDNSTTTVMCHDGDEYDKEKGVLLCFAKKLFGGGKYNDALRKALGDEAKRR